ncbi:NAD-dependent protein deacetylase sirtuin-6 [Physocladia obscura]|uniref:NAD-dependent protein deacetylase sirtuin-6 n=1 Tax=Physocladia obscura TaxID=109957 RepID=A0AAD5SYC9_9FUNG|nr:NAD-dependent protein deacetylase sirtuin-6 [Physocladia obscura]
MELRRTRAIKRSYRESDDDDDDRGDKKKETERDVSLLSYAERLQPIADKGLCGDAELEEEVAAVDEKARQVARLIAGSKYCVVLTGAGISTAEPASISDFRGPNGVWTCEKEGRTVPPSPRSMDDAKPTRTHEAIARLVTRGLVAHVVTQNIDALHLRAKMDVTAVPRARLSEVHGTAYALFCVACAVETRLAHMVDSIGLRPVAAVCRTCRAPLCDRLCDWDSPLPDGEINRAISELKKADLLLVVGSSMRIRPVGLWPRYTLKAGGKLVVINLQNTHLDKKSHVRIFAKSDQVFDGIMDELDFEEPTALNPPELNTRATNQIPEPVKNI